jgi:ubiquitin carboxyl-terminal hydrolase 5/13
MDLEINLNLTLSKIIEEGKQLIPLFGPGLTGLENLGNSCYMNSVLQVLFSFPEFRNRYHSDGLSQMHLLTCPKFAPECMMCQVAKLAEGIYSGKWSEKREAKKVEFEG